MASFLDRLKSWVTNAEEEKLDIPGVDLPEVSKTSSLDLGADKVLGALGLGSPSEEEIAAAIAPKVKQEEKATIESEVPNQGKDIVPKKEPQKEVESKLSDDTALPSLPGIYEETQSLRPGTERSDSSIQDMMGELRKQPQEEVERELSPQEKLLQELQKQKTEFNKRLEDSKKKDKWLSLMETGLPFLQQYVQGTTGTKSGLPTVSDPIKLDLDPFKTSDDVMAERKQSLQDLMTEYKLGKKDIKYTKDRVFEITPEGEIKVLKEFEQKLSPLQKQKLLQYGETQQRKLKDQQMRFNKNLYGVIKDFEKDDVTKALKKQNLAFNKVDNLLEMMKSGNEAVLSPLGISMAKAMGEVGVMTDKDVIRYIRTNGVVDEVKDFFSKKTAGVLTKKTQRNLKDIAEIFKILAKNKIHKTRDKYINIAYRNFGKDMDLSRDKVAHRFGQETDMMSSEEKSQELNKKDQQALNKAKENPESEISKKVIKHLEGKYGKQF